MNIHLFGAIVACSLLLSGSTRAQDQDSGDWKYHERPPVEDKIFNDFWMGFKAGVRSGSSAQVADLAYFPFSLQQRCVSREQFLNRYQDMFFKEVQQSILGKPLFAIASDNSWYKVMAEIPDANESMIEEMFFRRIGDQVRFTGYGLNSHDCLPANKSLKPTNPVQGDQ